jgi:hypothetical protein
VPATSKRRTFTCIPLTSSSYREHAGWHVFVGDPVAYGYDGPKHAYKGPHPIRVHEVVGDDTTDVEFCYLDGPHYHAFPPPDDPDVKVVGDVAFYVGTPPAEYVKARPQRVQINVRYKPLTYARPVVTVEAPAGWIGAKVEVIGPRADVIVPVIPVPSVNVEIGVVTAQAVARGLDGRRLDLLVGLQLVGTSVPDHEPVPRRTWRWCGPWRGSRSLHGSG